MKTLVLLCALSTGVTAPSLAAVVTEASAFASFAISAPCQDSYCTGPLKAKFVASEKLTISPGEESQLLQDTSFTLQLDNFFGDTTVEFALGDDPNFQNGDKSAKIKKTIQEIEPGVNLSISAQLNWGDGELEIKLTSKRTGQIVTGGAALPKSKEGKEVPVFDLELSVDRPGPINVFSTTPNLIGDIKVAEIQSIKSTGSGAIKVNASFKSTAIVVEP
jgi:hypothetical protein